MLCPRTSPMGPLDVRPSRYKPRDVSIGMARGYFKRCTILGDVLDGKYMLHRILWAALKFFPTLPTPTFPDGSAPHVITMQ